MATMFKKKGRAHWIIQYFDAQGKRREHSTHTTDRRLAERIKAKIAGEVALRREGVIDAKTDRYSTQNAVPLPKHVDAYIAHLEHASRSTSTIRDAKAHMAWIIEETGASRLSDLTLDAVERALGTLQARRLSARTVNHRGGSVRGFLTWAMRSGKIENNPLRFLPKQVEALDQRRTRRALTDEEVDRLMAVAADRGRRGWYLMALHAGLRLSELKKITWGGVNFTRNVLTISMGKARRVDEVPLHPDLRAELTRSKPAGALPTDRVFPTAVTNITRHRDYAAAGIPEVDEEGRHADLHSLRSTLGTRLARKGVPPQVAQRIMLHSDYRTTVKHYVRLELADTAAAVASLPSVTPVEVQVPVEPIEQRQQKRQHSEHVSAQAVAQ